MFSLNPPPSSSVRDEMEAATVTVLFKPSGSIRTRRKEKSQDPAPITGWECFQVVWRLPKIFKFFYIFFIFKRYTENREIRKMMRLRSSSSLTSNDIGSFLSLQIFLNVNIRKWKNQSEKK